MSNGLKKYQSFLIGIDKNVEKEVTAHLSKAGFDKDHINRINDIETLFKSDFKTECLLFMGGDFVEHIGKEEFKYYNLPSTFIVEKEKVSDYNLLQYGFRDILCLKDSYEKWFENIAKALQRDTPFFFSYLKESWYKDAISSLNNNGELEDDLKGLLQVLCQRFNFDRAELWFCSPGLDKINLEAVWRKSSSPDKRRWQHTSLLFGQEMPGKVWEEKRIIEGNKNAIGSYQNSNSSFGLPIYYQGEFIGCGIFEAHLRADILLARVRALKAILESTLGAEIKKRQMQEDIQAFFDFSPDISCISTDNGFFVEVNDAFSQVLGYSKEEILSRPIDFFVHPKDLKAPIYKTKIGSNEMDAYSFENRYRTRQGNWRWFSWTMIPMRDPTLYYATARDITKEKQQQHEMDRLIFNREAMINNTDDMVWLIDVMHNVLSANKRFKKVYKVVTGLELEVGMPALPEVLPGGYRDYWTEHYNRAIAGEKVNLNTSTEDDNRHYIISLDPVFDQEGNVIAVACHSKEITQTIEQIKAIEKQNSILRDIAWTQSHELRGPLSRMMTILGFLHQDIDTGLSNEELLQEMRRTTDEMDAVIKNIVYKSEKVDLDNIRGY